MGAPPLGAKRAQTEHSGDVPTERRNERRCGEASDMPETTQQQTTQHGTLEWRRHTQRDTKRT